MTSIKRSGVRPSLDNNDFDPDAEDDLYQSNRAPHVEANLGTFMLPPKRGNLTTVTINEAAETLPLETNSDLRSGIILYSYLQSLMEFSGPHEKEAKKIIRNLPPNFRTILLKITNLQEWRDVLEVAAIQLATRITCRKAAL
jgi:hypothetical protein